MVEHSVGVQASQILIVIRRGYFGVRPFILVLCSSFLARDCSQVYVLIRTVYCLLHHVFCRAHLRALLSVFRHQRIDHVIAE